MFYVYSFDETLKDLIKMEYLHNDRDVFMDYSWERALAIEGDVYPEWCLEFFSTMYFEKGVDRTKLMTEKCVWFRLYRKPNKTTRCEKKELWMMSALEDAHGYYVDKETKKCSKSIECEKWTTKMLAKELDFENQTLLPSMLLPQPPRVTREQRQKLSGLNSSWGDWDVSLNEMERQEMVILHVQC
uniref:Uncharacterized protein n=1 Tax=Tanacetum cinerariifolium TaxID=118510 RepID=A0A699QXF8_TANCI|nr:hypothetical protein [Tanacetum cinerariifolium]